MTESIGVIDPYPTFLEKASQPVNDSLIQVSFQQKTKTFFRAQTSITDYGACSVIYPNLNFINDETKGAIQKLR